MRFWFTYFFVFILLSATAYSQELLQENQKRSRDFEERVSTLVSNITQGKTSEREKFEAIFTWVAENIRYDYKVYFSSQGGSKTNIKKVLKERKAICVDYATLMDTLCAVAGLTNVSVYGYAKDDIFDVNDSLYIDNHAWNAIRLDGLWYLYDATWAAGSRGYEYRTVSRFLMKIFEGIKPKFKKRKIKQKYFFPGSSCKIEAAYYYKQRIFNRGIIWLLSGFRLHIKEVYEEGNKYQFYLADPKLFYITHYPDEPVWTLLGNKTLRNFECDSAFYHLTDNSYADQKPEGIACHACDSSLIKSKEQNLKTLKERSSQSNRRNRFIISYCEFLLGDLYHSAAVNTSDSSERARLLSLAWNNFTECGQSLKQCRSNIEIDYKLQQQKNEHKQDLLLEDNKTHTSFLKRQASLILAESRNNKALASKIKASSGKVGNSLFYLPTGTPDKKKPKPSKRMQERLNKLTTDYQHALIKLDSIKREIRNKETIFDVFLFNVSDRVWKKGIHYDSLIEPFKMSSYYRRLLKDNYKKEVVEIRKLIPVYERDYEYDLENSLFAPSRMAFASGSDIISAISKKCYLQKKIFGMAKELEKYAIISYTSFQDLNNQMNTENKEDCCWLESRLPRLVSTYMGFDFLKTQQRRMEVVINFENSGERSRLYKIENELKRRKKKYKNIVSHNSSAVLVKIRQVKASKRKSAKVS